MPSHPEDVADVAGVREDAEVLADLEVDFKGDLEVIPGGPLRRRERLIRFCRRHRLLTGTAILLLPFALLLSYTWVQAMTKPGPESFLARNVQWMRDMHMGWLVDRVEQKYYEHEQPPDGGTPDQAIAPVGPAAEGNPVEQGRSSSSAPAPASTIPHLQPPSRLPSPAAELLPNEGEWFPAGPEMPGGLHGVYTTKVRPNAQKTSLLVFVAWIDPKLTNIKIHPGTELPGGKLATPSFIPPEQCADAILAVNGGFRFDQARGGWYSEGKEAPGKPLRDGAASLVLFKDGSVGYGMWGRDYTDADLERIDTVRQNLDLMVDNGQIVDDLDKKDWGAQLKNSYFIWRSGYGITADGALIFVGGPGLQPRDLAQTLINAGAVRGGEGDINPEWVVSNLYSVGPDGKCHGTKGLEGPEDKGGQRSSADRYLKTDTRDFIAVYRKPIPAPG
jgi:hypothetical protein